MTPERQSGGGIALLGQVVDEEGYFIGSIYIFETEIGVEYAKPALDSIRVVEQVIMDPPLKRRGESVCRLHHIERDIDDHILLPADHLAAACLGEDGAGIDAVIGCCLFGMAQEGRVHPGIAER
jgi:hypothetical protein